MGESLGHLVEFPRVMLVGSQALLKISEISSQLSKGKNAVIVAGDITMKIAGNKAKELLESDGYSVSSSISELASENAVSAAQNTIKNSNADIVLGIGGGTAIDIAKLSSSRENIPFISVPTAASHDGIGSPIASIKGNGSFKSYPAKVPIAIIADTSIIVSAPYRMTASGCADLISNITSVEDWKLAHKLKGEYFGDYAASLAGMSAQVIIDNASAIRENLESSIKLVVEGLITSGTAMCISGSSRPCSGAEHLFSHALDRISKNPAMHGEQCGVGTIMMAYLHKMDWEKIKNSLKSVGAPVNANELGVSDDEIIKALTMAHTIRDRYTILGSKGLTEDAARNLAKTTGVI